MILTKNTIVNLAGSPRPDLTLWIALVDCKQKSFNVTILTKLFPCIINWVC